MKTLLTFALTMMLSAAPVYADDHSENVVLINTFTVPSSKLNEAIAMWDSARAFLETQPGYVSTRLHQSISPDARYLLINVAEWESPEAFQNATTLMRQQGNLPRIEGVVPGPQLYSVIRE